MAKSGPSKKRKTTVVLSSDDEESETSSNVTVGAKPSKDIQSVLKNASYSPQPGRTTAHAPKRLEDARNGGAALKSSPKTTQASPVKDRLKAVRAKPIYSFFNAATQKQQTRTSPGPKKEECKNRLNVENDLIQDEESQENALSANTVSRFGAKYPVPTRQKRKHSSTEGDGTEHSAAPRGSQLFKKNASGPTNGLNPGRDEEDKRPWMERFSPTSSDELAVHKKKVQDVRNWLAAVTAGNEPKSILLLKGPAGSGKTTTLAIIARELGCSLQEWRNPNHLVLGDEGYVSMAAQFEDFVVRAGTFGALAMEDDEQQSVEIARGRECDRKEIILVEDFPNTSTRTSPALQNFRNAITQYLCAATPSLNSFFSRNGSQSRHITPIVMIISETILSTGATAADSFTAHRLLGPDILTHPGVTVIDFNPIAPTFMTKALELVLRKESRKSGRRTAPGPAVLKQLSELGDIRNAISSLEFLCLRGDDHPGWSGKITFAKGKNSTSNNPPTKAETDSLEAITNRESALGIFHAVARVVHNKREAPAANETPPPQPPSFLPQHTRPKVPEVNADSLLNELGIDIQIFIAALHENYVLSCGGFTPEDTLGYINGCIDNLSDSDVLSPERFGNVQKRTLQGTAGDSLRQDEISFQTSVRGLLFSLPHPVKRLPLPSNLSGSTGRSQRYVAAASYQMFYPRSQQLWRRIEEKEEVLEQLVARMHNQSAAPKASSASGPQAPAGVETWRRHQPFAGLANSPATPSQTHTNQPGDETTPPTTGANIRIMNKVELLLERLPYMAVLEKKRASPASTALVKDLEKLTRIAGAIPRPDEDNDPDADADDDAESGEQWTTENAGDEPGTPSKKKNLFGIKAKGSDAVVGLKDKTAQLVLSDDDIVDD